MIDLGKKIIMKYCNKDSSVDEILEKYYQFFKVSDLYKISDYQKIYEYYKLEKPDDQWLEYCINNQQIKYHLIDIIEGYIHSIF